jgi:hypothetical protein
MFRDPDPSFVRVYVLVMWIKRVEERRQCWNVRMEEKCLGRGKGPTHGPILSVLSQIHPFQISQNHQDRILEVALLGSRITVFYSTSRCINISIISCIIFVLGRNHMTLVPLDPEVHIERLLSSTCPSVESHLVLSDLV